jgi:hypothetical protein
MVREDSDNYYLIPKNGIIVIPKNECYDKKTNAQYKLFVDRVSSGIPIQNYRKSKYYKYYIERAKKENPEILI